MKNKALGSYLAAVAAVLSLAAVVVYNFVSIQNSAVMGLLIGAVVLAAASVALSKLVENNWIVALLPVATSVVITLAIGNAFTPMVDQLGFVVSGLDPVSTIAGFITYVVITAIAMIASVVSCFTSFEK